MSRRSRYTAAGLVRRQLAAEPGTAVLVVLTVLLVSLVVTATPRAVTSLLDEDLEDRLGSLSAARADPRQDLAWPSVERVDDLQGSAVLRATADVLAERAREAGPALRPALGTPEVVATRPRFEVEKGPRAADIHTMGLAVRLDTGIEERVDVVDGRLPGPAAGGTDGTADDEDAPIEVMASPAVAEQMRWRVGEERTLVSSVALRFVLVGTFEPREPDAGYWSHLATSLVPSVVDDWDVGILVDGVVYADPSTLPRLSVPAGLEVVTWYPVDRAQVARADRDSLLPELRAFLADTRTTSELAPALEATARRQATLAALLAVLAVGPAGAALGVLWIAGRLAAARRGTALRLSTARGASSTAQAVAMAAQGAVLGLPAAALGAVAATVLIPGTVRPGTVVAALVVGLLPALLMGGAAREAVRSAQPGRRGRASRWRRLRPVGEVVLVGLAAVSLVAARQRGLAGGPGGPDPVVTAAPVLLAAAVCVLLLRVHHLPLRAVAGVLRRGRGLADYLGAAQATRRPAAGLAPVVALVLGVAVCVFSGVTLTTLQAGTEHAAARSVGADLRLEGRTLDADDVAAVRAIEGVAHVAGVGRAGSGRVDVAGSVHRVDVWTVDAHELAAVQRSLPAVGTAGVALDDAAADPLPAVLVARDGVVPGVEAALALVEQEEPVGLAVADADAVMPGVASGTQWLVVDRGAFAERTGREGDVQRLLVALAPGASLQEVRDQALTVLGADVVASAPEDVRRRLGQVPLVRGTAAGLMSVTAVSALLCVVVVVLTLALGAPARERSAGLLMTLGAPRSTATRLVLWEVVPVVGLALLGGAVVGGVLPTLLLGTADLRPFTGGTSPPGLVVDPLLLAGLAGGGALAVGAALLAAAVRARHVRAAVVLREGERS